MILNTITQIGDKTTNATEDQIDFKYDLKGEGKSNTRMKMKNWRQS